MCYNKAKACSHVMMKDGITVMKRTILASGSPRRKELLEQIGMEFIVITSEADEHTDITDPEQYVIYLSGIKAEAVHNKIQESNIDDIVSDEEWQQDIKEGDYVIIGADTIVSHKGHILTKPKDEQDAYNMLKELSGDCHQVYTGVTLMYGDGRKKSFAGRTDVYCYELTDKEIWDYISTGEPMDKAGDYGIQGRFAAFIKKIDGDYNNVVGLPVAGVYQEMKL